MPELTITQRVSVTRRSEERGSVDVWRIFLEQLIRAPRDETAPADLEAWIAASETRLASAEKYEREHGQYSLLKADDDFNLSYPATLHKLAIAGKLLTV